MTSEARFFLVREDVLPEALAKTAEAKRMLQFDEVRTVNEAVRRVGLSRSAFYKYREGILPYQSLDFRQWVTLAMELEHRSGVLSGVLATVAQAGGNVLTMHQTIPLQGIAHVVLTVDTERLQMETARLLQDLLSRSGVLHVNLIGRG